jgi:CIC family chloride channel protein
VVGAAVGILGWFAPDLIGGGDAITQSVLAGSASLAALPAVFLLRFALGAVSYAAGTPGGLFAPMLVLGAQFGFLSGAVCRTLLPYLDVQPEGFAIVGMAAFFAGVVRAPITGIVLATEIAADVMRVRGGHAGADVAPRSAHLRVASRARLADRSTRCEI